MKKLFWKVAERSKRWRWMRNLVWELADHYVTHYDAHPEKEAALKPEQKEALATLRAMIYSRRTGKMGWENGTVGDLFL